MKILNALPLISNLKRQADEHKGHSGKVLIIGGAPSMAGALVLSGIGALYTGAGWINLMMLDSASAQLISSQPELMIHSALGLQPEKALTTIEPQVIAIGPGLGLSEQSYKWVEAALMWHGLVVIDADAINLIAKNVQLLGLLQNRSYASVLTPHPGEAARLLGITTRDIQNNRELSINNLCDLTKSIIVLKGYHTLVASPHNPPEQCLQGNPGMATGGMGDVLTGCICALAAQGIHHEIDLWQASRLGVQIHAMAGDALSDQGIGPIGMTPSELAQKIRFLINQH